MTKNSFGIFAALLALGVSTQAQTLEFDAEVYNVNEGAGAVTLTVVKKGAATGPVTVHYATTDVPGSSSSATSPDDYTASAGDLTFAENETVKQFSIPITEDAIYDGFETFFVVLSNPTGGATLRNPSRADVNIVDNDPPPTVQFGSANYNANEGAGIATLTITKTGPTDERVTAYYKTRDGSATAPSDYTFTGDDLTASVYFEPLETSHEIQIALNNDNFMEPSETFEAFLTVTLGANHGTPASATVTIADDDAQDPQPPAQTLNISTRAKVLTGDRVMISGFITRGNDYKSVALRALGPSLAQAGLPPGQVLLDPRLELRGSDGSHIFENDNWKENSAQRHLIEGTSYEPKDDREAAIVIRLDPGAYTAIVTGGTQTAGIGLVEVYDYDLNAAADLGNISTRGYVGAENDVMIGGFILGRNPASVRVAVRGLGPSLTNSGLNDVLPDPRLQLHNANGAVLVSNDDWQSDPVSAEQLVAHGLALPSEKESGIFTVLPPGQFTALLQGKNNGVGIGLVEIYNLR